MSVDAQNRRHFYNFLRYPQKGTWNNFPLWELDTEHPQKGGIESPVHPQKGGIESPVHPQKGGIEIFV